MTRILTSVLALGLLAAPARPADDPAAKEVEAALAALNKAFETRDAAAIERLTTPDHRAVTPWGGVQTRADQVKTLPDLKLAEYTPGPVAVTRLGADAALVPYSLKMRGTFRDKPLPAESQASAVWVRRGGTWLEAHYQETAPAGR